MADLVRITTRLLRGLRRVDGLCQSSDVDEPEDELYQGEVNVSELLVPCGEASELLRFSEEALDAIPRFVGLGHFLIPGPGRNAVRLVRDHRQGVEVVEDRNADCVRVEGLVAEHLADRPDDRPRSRKDRGGQCRVVLLPLGHVHRDDTVLVARDGDNLRRQPAA